MPDYIEKLTAKAEALRGRQFHCFHNKDARAPLDPGLSTDIVVCCWCGQETPKYVLGGPIGVHGPFGPQSLWINREMDGEACLGDIGKGKLGGPHNELKKGGA